MRSRLLLLPLAAFAALALYVSVGAGAGPNPVTCEGYPEPRIFLENQSWWEPQTGPAAHPGTGKQGHIHVGACFPVYQTLSGTSLHLDVVVKLHNMPGVPSWLRAQSYGDVGWEKRIPIVDQNPAKYIPRCTTANCEYTLPWDIDLSIVRYNGWHQFGMFLNVAEDGGANTQRQWTRWYVNFDIPGRPVGTPGPDGQFGTLASIYSQWTGGDTWYNGVDAKYAQASIRRDSLPWNETTGELQAVPAIWTPTVRFEKAKQFVFIDPNLHAPGGPDYGTVVLDRTVATGAIETLSIDTTGLSNGVHKLLIGTGNVTASGTNSGVLVIPFLVHNVVCA